MNVFRSSKEIYVQVIDDYRGYTLVSASSIDQKLHAELEGLSRMEKAEKVGQVIAERAKEVGVTQVVFDRGGYKYIGRVKVMAEAARAGGLEF